MTEPQEDKGKVPAQDPGADSYANSNQATDTADKPSETTESSPEEKGKKPLAAEIKEKVAKLSLTSKEDKKVTPQMLQALFDMNPSISDEFKDMPPDQAAAKLINMDVTKILTGMSLGKKNQKDMASHKFWQTQPVPRFDDQENLAEGPIKIINPEEVSKEPPQLIEGFEWVTLDVTDDNEVAELYELLSNHYVEDENAMFRFKYSRSFLNWALTSPGWKKEWHVGVRATKSGKLVASICGVPTYVRVRDQKLKVIEINFLCVHKKLRSKRLAPVLIKEVTRRCYLKGIYQAIYTAGVVLPKPVTSCRYYHRSLNWLKLYEVGFSPLPAGSTKSRQITRNHLPTKTATAGLRKMQKKDLDAVYGLLERFLTRFDINPAFSRKEIDHWLLHQEERGDQVVWSYVVEDPHSKKITDFVSFYSLPSSVIGNPKHKEVRAAYLYYYASETAFNPYENGLKERLQLLINDALIEAKKAHFDVFNALTLQDNPLFLEQLKFGAGDGQLHYYLYNYRTAPVTGGVDHKNLPDERKRGGMGVVLL